MFASLAFPHLLYKNVLLSFKECQPSLFYESIELSFFHFIFAQLYYLVNTVPHLLKTVCMAKQFFVSMNKLYSLRN